MRLFTFVFFILISFSYSQIDFTRYVGNPVLKYGSGFEEFGALAPTIIKEDDGWKMWYHGWSGASGKAEIGYATSENGINWIKYEGNPVVSLVDSINWLDDALFDPSVIKDDGIYKMWFSATGNVINGFIQDESIGYATSEDGINWKIENNMQPVKLGGDTTTYDIKGAGFTSILKHDGIYKMWYSSNSGQIYSISYATSLDGVTWDKHQQNPVMSPEESFQEDDIFSPSVIYHNGYFHMWYSRTVSNFSNSSIAYAISTDGINWTKTEEAVLKPTAINNSWEREFVDYPFAMLDNDTLKMWYTGIGPRGNSAFYTANATGYAYDTGFVTGIEHSKPSIINTFLLEQNYPNPFNPVTTINYQLETKTEVTLIVYDIAGREIKTLVNKQQNAGTHSVTFDASSFPSGIYVYKISAGQFEQSRKMILVK